MINTTRDAALRSAQSAWVVEEASEESVTEGRKWFDRFIASLA